MGKRSDEAIDCTYEELKRYLHANHSAYMQVGEITYYLTDVNSHAWRAQDTDTLNDKGHFVDCSDLVSTLDEFLALPFVNGRTIPQVFSEATFFASGKGLEAYE